MSIITRKTGAKRYSYSICTDEILRHKYINGPYFATKKEAKEAEATALAQLQTGTYTEPTKMTVNELLETVIGLKAVLRPSSISSLNSFAKRVKSQPLGAMRLNSEISQIL